MKIRVGFLILGAIAGYVAAGIALLLGAGWLVSLCILFTVAPLTALLLFLMRDNSPPAGALSNWLQGTRGIVARQPKPHAEIPDSTE